MVRKTQLALTDLTSVDVGESLLQTVLDDDLLAIGRSTGMPSPLPVRQMS